ncbi:MAG TPA: hypothetical protein VH186_36500, partial [Chloroflexia bacterium]|nr:hypothetical protein [Chloroflexia bacterium]
AQAVKWVKKSNIPLPYTGSSHPAYSRPSHKEKTHAKPSSDSGRSNEQGKAQIYDSWLVAAGLKKSGVTSARLAAGE